MDLMLRSFLGMLVLLFIGWCLSLNRKNIAWRVVIGGTLLQLVFAFLVLKTEAGKAFFFAVNDVIVALLGFAKAGASFVFGNLVNNNVPVGVPKCGMESPFAPMTEFLPSSVSSMANVGSFFAFSVLPTIIFFAAFMAVLYHLGVMQKVVKMFAWVMQKTLKTSGAETLSASANIFVGQTEAPLIIRPYLAKMTRSELFCIMTGGFATVAGGVMAAYVGFLMDKFPTIAGHLMAASVMSAPAALVFAKLICPEDDVPVTRDGTHTDIPKIDANVIDAASRGTTEGLHLAMNVGAMLIAFIALIALGDKVVALIFTPLSSVCGFCAEVATAPSPLKLLFGYCFAPLAWIMGVRSEDMRLVGELMATKTVINEFVAYLDLSTMLDKLSPRSTIIAIYALCGFSNFSSIGIQIGGISALCPERRSDLAKIGLRAMIAGCLACFMTATIAGGIQTEESALTASRVVYEQAVTDTTAVVPAADTAAAPAPAATPAADTAAR